jgi:hypothetical protein
METALFLHWFLCQLPFYTTPQLKTLQNPMSSSDAPDNGWREIPNNDTESFDDHIEGLENLVAEAELTDFFPNLLDWIHFWCIWWKKQKFNVSWNY